MLLHCSHNSTVEEGALDAGALDSNRFRVSGFLENQDRVSEIGDRGSRIEDRGSRKGDRGSRMEETTCNCAGFSAEKICSHSLAVAQTFLKKPNIGSNMSTLANAGVNTSASGKKGQRNEAESPA